MEYSSDIKTRPFYILFMNLMGSKSLVALKSHVGSFNMSFVNDFVYGNMLWAFGSLRVLICNFVVYFFGFILRYISRFLDVGDAKNELIVKQSQVDSEGNGFSEELASFLFWNEDVYEGGGDRETESSAFMEDSEKRDGETECSVFMDSYSDIIEDSEETEVSDFMEIDSSIHEDGKKNGKEKMKGFHFMETDSCSNEYETECSVFKENHHDIMQKEEEKEEEKTIEPVSMNTNSNSHEQDKKSDGDETESSVSVNSSNKLHENEAETSVIMETGLNVHDYSKNREEEEEEEKEVPFFVESELATSTSKCQYMSGKDTISGFMEEPSAMSFSFREFYMGPDVLSFSNNSCTNTEIIADKEFSVVLDLEEQETEYSVPKQVSTHPNTGIPFRFDSVAFGGTDSSDDEDDGGGVLSNESSSLVSDSESVSSCSSGLIWGDDSNKVEDSIAAYEFLGGFESEILKLILREEKSEGVFEEKQFSCDEFIEMDPGKKSFKPLNDEHEEKGSMIGLKTSEEAKWEEGLCDEDDFEWEHDDLVEQLKLELRNARQGGLATIFEEDEDGDGDGDGGDGEEEVEEEVKVMESPKVVEEDLEAMKEIEEKFEYKDLLDEIEKVYKSYAEKMRKLDILNYQTMHALGLIQLKDPLKIISTPKSNTTIGGAKHTIISQNLWPRKASKNKTDPILKFVHELQRDLELVYVGQICLSWEILCWQHMKAQELQQFETQEPHRYNLVAGEFQLFQVLMNRFIENEPFQGPRIQNYVKNRCVIRNLLQVPAIKDDSMKDRNITKENEEVPIGSGKLADIIKESMRVFWEFVRADKDYGNVILKVSQQMGNDLKDPAISVLLEDIRTQLPKKEKRLKDIVRTGNCIVKKFQKHHEDQLDHEQLVAQVGLKLISRVLNMSRLRKEQFIWCHEKLHRINFLSRKIVHVEPSFLLFPC